MNLSGTLNAFRALASPRLLLPHHTVASFDLLPHPLHTALARADGAHPDIRAVVLDKDNCITVPDALELYRPYEKRFKLLREEFPGNRVLVVSNSSGTGGVRLAESAILKRTLGCLVLSHSTKKPGCHPTVLSELLQSGTVTHPSQIAIVGDRLFTDIMMANLMGSWGIWISDGVPMVGGLKRRRRSLLSNLERSMEGWMRKRGWVPPMPEELN